MSTDRDTLTELVDLTYNQCINTRPIRSPYQAIADAVLREGWRPPPRRIETAEELDKLPPESVVLDRDRAAWQARGKGLWAVYGYSTGNSCRVLVGGPVTLVWTPGGEA